MVTRSDVTELTSAVKELVRMAKADLAGFFGSLNMALPESARDALVEYLPILVQEYGDMAATVAAEWYEKNHPGYYQALLADTFPTDGLVGGVKYHAGNLFTDNPNLTLSGLSDSLGRYIQYSSRGTIARNVSLDPEKPRYGRVPTGSVTCAWCSMLASRGFVYLTEKTAGLNKHYHNGCDCQIVPSWEQNQAVIKGYDPDALYGQYKAAWEAAGGTGVTDNQVVAMMRQMFPSSFSDGVAS